MKFIFRLIGILVVIMILMMAVLCYMDTKGLLNGKLERLIDVLRRLGKEAWTEIMLFMSNSGIAEDAAGLLDQGASYLRDSVTPHATDKPGSDAFPEGYLTPTPVPTATPTAVATATPVPTVSPAPALTPYIVTMG
ncbi:MAG: hypothetical protein RRZ24_00515 [Clostridia bacterium]